MVTELSSMLSEFILVIGPYSTPISYFLVFFVLTLCGIGLPMPEDIVLMAAGLCIYHNIATFEGMVFFSILGVLFGDYLIFYIGKRWGKWFLSHRVFMNAFSNERLARVHDYFDRYGSKTVFFARFIWGLRAATFFIAGTHTMSAKRFLLLDLLGALVSVPLIIYISSYFGGHIEKAAILIKQTNHIVMSIIFIILLIFIIRHFRKNKKNKKNNAQ